MSFSKTIICLANSKKYSHRCIAGKEFQANQIGSWIRPVTEQLHGEVPLEDMAFENGTIPSLLDIIDVPLVRHAPHTYQTENYVIDSKYYWVKKGVFPGRQMHTLCDQPEFLWINAYHSFNGVHDAVPLEIAETQLTTSLLLIQSSSLNIHVTDETYGRKIRAQFSFGAETYKFAVTDPTVVQFYLRGNNGIFRLGNRDRYLCISLGEPIKGICYKLVAAILPFP